MLPAHGPAQVRVSWLGCSSVGKDLVFVMDSEVNVSHQCALVAVKANTLGCTWERRTRMVNTPPVLVRLRFGGLYPVGLSSVIPPLEY